MDLEEPTYEELIIGNEVSNNYLIEKVFGPKLESAIGNSGVTITCSRFWPGTTSSIIMDLGGISITSQISFQ